MMGYTGIIFGFIIIICGDSTQAQRLCPRPEAPTFGFISRCTNSVNHLSVCSTICEPGFEIRGDSRMLCWCGVKSCAWRGVKPTCEMTTCNGPDYDEGRVRVVDQWPSGFIGVMELDNVPEVPTKLTSGWSMVLILDRPLGKNVTLSSWNADLVSISYDKRTFTFTNTDHNSDLSNYLPTSNIRWAFVVDNLENGMPKTAYLGLFNRRINDATCVKAPKMLDIEPITSYVRVPETTPTTTTRTTEKSTTTIPTTTSPSTTTTTTTTTTPATTTTTTTTTTTPIPTTIKKKKKPRRRRRKKQKKQTTPAPSVETTLPTELATIFPQDPTTESTLKISENDTLLEKSGGRYCVLQTHKDNFKTQDGWEDGGIPFFSGNCILNVTDHLLDWAMLVIFDSPIAEMQVWSVTMVEKSEDGRMWTFGPHEWNIDLYVGQTDINFIAKQATKTPQTPTAKVYLCSLAFTEGDTIVISPNSPAQIALATGTLGMDKDEEIIDATDNDVTVEEEAEEEEKPEELASKVARWKKPDKIEKRCLPESPNGIVPAKQEQTKPDFKPNDDGTKYNYNELLHKSILFYEAQRAGRLPRNNRIPWRGDSTLKDGCDIGVDLSGGWFDAGDHVKFTLPMASSVTLLAWGGLMFKEAYKDAGELQNLLDSIKWPGQFLMRAHISKYEFVAQVGSGHIDHVTYGRPEEMRMKRPTYVLDPEHPGSEPTAETAAALAAAHILLKTSHRQFAKNAIKHAEELFEFADKFRGEYHNSVQDVKDFYFSYSGYNDELIWAAAWLYKATGNSKYLLKAKGLYIELGGQYAVESEFSWDRKLIGAQILLANLTGEELYRKPISGFLENVVNAKKTPKGLMWLRKWGSNRYAANAAFMVMAASTLTPPLPKMEIYVEWARKQIHLVLGDIGRSYVVGFGKNYPQRVHHRGSACTPAPALCSRKTFYTPRPSYYVLYGGLVGGPDQKEIYSDNRVVYEQTEVACDYNAGFQGAVAGLKQIAVKKRPPKSSYTTHNLGKWSG